MKKTIYYVSPFIVFPLVFLLDDLWKSIYIANYYDVAPVFFKIVAFLFPAIIGSLSTTNKKFDYLMTAIVPLSFFLSLFFALYFEEIYECVRFSLDHALNMEYYKLWLPNVVVMTAITFVTSFRPIRISRWLWNTDQK